MSTVSWGGPKLQFIPIAAGAIPPAGSWSAVTGLVEIPADDLLQNSSQLNTTEGEVKELKNEFGVTVDRKQMPASYVFTAGLIRKKGAAQKFSANNGIVPGDWAMRLIPEDPQTIGFQFGKCGITIAKGWSGEQGMIDTLSVSGVEPNGSDKEICKEYSVASSGSGSAS